MTIRSMNARFCKALGCNRPLRARGYCQTHYKHLLKRGEPHPIVPQRPPRPGSVRMAGLGLTRQVVQWITREAKRLSVTQNAVITDIIEAWARRQR